MTFLVFLAQLCTGCVPGQGEMPAVRQGVADLRPTSWTYPSTLDSNHLAGRSVSAVCLFLRFTSSGGKHCPKTVESLPNCLHCNLQECTMCAYFKHRRFRAMLFCVRPVCCRLDRLSKLTLNGFSLTSIGLAAAESGSKVDCFGQGPLELANTNQAITIFSDQGSRGSLGLLSD
jgi:hypothetical protein